LALIGVSTGDNMKIKLLNYICCPLCKDELQLYVFEWNFEDEKFTQGEKDKLKKLIGNFSDIRNELSQIYSASKIENLDVLYGVFYCRSCKRWYPIGNLIPSVPELYYPDELRNEQQELKFLEKWKNLLPPHIVLKSKPWNLSTKNDK